MDTEEKFIIACPSCNCSYSVPETFKGRTASCKRCGVKFKLSFVAADTQQEVEKHIAVQKGIEEISGEDSLLVLGRLALKFKFLTKEQLQQALSFQKREKQGARKLRLGEILVTKGMISQNQLDFLLSVQKMYETKVQDRRFGEIAVTNGFATRDNVNRAYEEQKRIF